MPRIKVVLEGSGDHELVATREEFEAAREQAMEFLGEQMKALLPPNAAVSVLMTLEED